jgi:hypothetical protein
LTKVDDDHATWQMTKLLQGGSDPGVPHGYLMGGVFASGVAGTGNPTGVRDDISGSAPPVNPPWNTTLEKLPADVFAVSIPDEDAAHSLVILLLAQTDLLDPASQC